MKKLKTAIILGLLACALSPLAKAQNTVTILHFNDVYHLSPQNKQQSAGLARASTFIKNNQQSQPLILFSGDAFGGSALSTEFQGQQMVAAFNFLGVDFAGCGNHEFDFGVEVTTKRVQESKFPWLCANLTYPKTSRYSQSSHGKPIAKMQSHKILEKNGYKILMMGLAEDFRTSTLLSEDDVFYTDYVAKAREIIQNTESQNIDIIIALTHMDMKHDERLAQAVPAIDLILGGHDHEPMQKIINDTLIWKTGSDWHHIGKLVIQKIKNQKLQIVAKENIKLNASIQPDANAEKLVQKYTAEFNKSLAQVLTFTQTDLNCIRKNVRTQETNFGNLVADALVDYTNADFALTNGGGMRADSILPKGPITKKQILTAIPFGNKIVSLKLTGTQVLEALEKGVSEIENTGGGFLQTSKDFRYKFNSQKPKGKRVIGAWFKDKPLEPSKLYTVATNNYVAKFEPFSKAQFVISPDTGDLDFNVLTRYLRKKKRVAPEVEGRIVNSSLSKR